MTMIEKMARQIAADFGVKPFLEYDNNKTFYENIAKSALKAMLEPTEEMYAKIDVTDEGAVGIYADMIQAAIDEK